MKSAGFLHKKFLFCKSNASSSGLRKKFLDKGTPPNKFPDTSLGCRVSSKANGVIIRHIDRSILHKTSADTNFSNLVLAQKEVFGGFRSVNIGGPTFFEGCFSTSSACRKISRSLINIIWVCNIIYVHRATRRIKNQTHTMSRSKVMDHKSPTDEQNKALWGSTVDL